MNKSKEEELREIEKHYDKFLEYYYNAPCKGCPEGHASFWKTVIESPQWKEWQKEQAREMTRDMPECEELGILSPSHFQEFMKFTLASHQLEMEKKIKEAWDYPCNCYKKNIECKHNYNTMHAVLSILRGEKQ